MFETEKDFFTWEKASLDTIDFKKIYVDITGDIVTGLLLSQIIYWHLPSKKNPEENKLRVVRDNKKWLVKKRSDWWEECRISEKQFDRSSKKLQEKNIIEVEIHKFNGTPTLYIHLKMDVFLNLINEQYNKSTEEDISDFTQRGKSKLPKGENESYPKGNINVPQTVTSLYTENTTKNTSEITNTSSYEEEKKESKAPIGSSFSPPGEKTKAKANKISFEEVKLDKTTIYNDIKSLYIKRWGKELPHNFSKFVDFIMNMKLSFRYKNINSIVERLFNDYEWDLITEAFTAINRKIKIKDISEYTYEYFDRKILFLSKPKVIDNYDYSTYICVCGESLTIVDESLDRCPECNTYIDYNNLFKFDPIAKAN